MDVGPGQELTAAEMDRAGLLQMGQGCAVSRYTLFVPVDRLGVRRPVWVGDSCEIGPFTVVHGGARLGDGVRVEGRAVVGVPERGYAVGHVYRGHGDQTVLAGGAVARAGAVLYAGVDLGEGTTIGHATVLRSFVTVGANGNLGHHLVVERDVRIGVGVRCSPLSHLTSSTILADGVFLGAGIRTINDRRLDRGGALAPPRFERNARVGSGSTIMSGVAVGERALVGAGSLVLRDVPADTTVAGVPARPMLTTTGR